MMKAVLERIGIDILLFIMVLVAPWWLSLVAIFLSMLYFRVFIESIFFGAVLDILFASSLVGAVFIGGYFYTTLFLLLFIVSLIIRPRIRIFSR